MSPVSDADLDLAMCRTRLGDTEAFDLVVRALHWQLRGWLALRVPAAIDSDELAQTVFVEAFRNAARYQPGSSVRSWLWTIARYQLMGALTTLRRQQEHQASLPEAIAGPDEHPEVAESAILALRDCLASLQPAARDMVERHYLLNQPLAEIATVAGRSLGAIKKALFTIRRQLEVCLRQRTAEVGS